MKNLNPILISFFLWIALYCSIASANLIDPTRPPDAFMPKNPTGPVASRVLTAVFIYPKHRIAIINGKVLRIGDRLGEFTITAITLYTVELTGPRGTKEVLYLNPYVKK